jgi:hypothetical protein
LVVGGRSTFNPICYSTAPHIPELERAHTFAIIKNVPHAFGVEAASRFEPCDNQCEASSS